MARCPNVHTALIIRQNVFSPRLRRREILPKGMPPSVTSIGQQGHRLMISYRAKYIEGLENRMRRLEGLLKMAGIADSDTDIPSIERRLQQAQQSQHNDLHGFSAATAAARSSLETAGKSRAGSLHSTPPLDSNSSPRVADSPVSQEDKEHEVEALSDMMCSLVTNNCGETRYIGMYLCLLDYLLIAPRLRFAQVPPPAFQSSHLVAFNGLMKKRATLHSTI